jgi:hypothetical protein
MTIIVALYSLMRRARSVRCSAFNFSRSTPMAAGEIGGATSLRTARAAIAGCDTCASALASSSVTGPVSGTAAIAAILARVVEKAPAVVFAGFVVRDPARFFAAFFATFFPVFPRFVVRAI